MMRLRPTPRTGIGRLLALLLAFVLVAAACGDDSDSAADDGGTTVDEGSGDTTADDATTGDAAADDGEVDDAVPADGPTIIIGAQDFGESAILASLYGQALTAAGYDVEQQAVGGYRDVSFDAFASGDINFTLEYAASALEFLNSYAGEASSDVDATAALLATQLGTLDIGAYEASPAADSNAFVVTEATAADGIAAVSDLTEDMSLGGPADCEENAACIPGLIDVYGIDLSAGFVPLDGAGPLTVAALEGGEVDVAVLFSTSGAIVANDFVVLDDDLGMINADNIVPIASEDVMSAYGDDLAAVVDGISAELTTEDLAEMNRRYEIDKDDAEVIAEEWLTGHGLL